MAPVLGEVTAGRHGFLLKRDRQIPTEVSKT
jgi:hypothetical protein